MKYKGVTYEIIGARDYSQETKRMRVGETKADRSQPQARRRQTRRVTLALMPEQVERYRAAADKRTIEAWLIELADAACNGMPTRVHEPSLRLHRQRCLYALEQAGMPHAWRLTRRRVEDRGPLSVFGYSLALGLALCAEKTGRAQRGEQLAAVTLHCAALVDLR